MIAASLLKISIQALWANKLRTGLTLLGVIIGVTSVMTIISALEGMMGAVESQLDRLGPSTFIATTIGGVATSEEQWHEMLKRKPIDIDYADDILEGCELCEKVCPRTFNSANIKYRGERLRDVFVMGSTYNLIDVVDFEVDQGHFHSREDDIYRREVVFIGETVREALFSGVDAIGKSIRLDGKKYTVVGVAKKMGSMFGQDRDKFVVIPLDVSIKQFGKPRRNSNFVIKARSVDDLDEAMDEARIVLRSLRHVPYDKPDDFILLTADAILDQLNSVTRIFRMGLVGISSISLVVGGIVVMNIMMVSVSERTREIGIRKSVGARQNHILLQFLFEALLTTLTGGLIGIVLGYIAAASLVQMIDMQISPSVFGMVAGLSISTGIGVIFGIYPAMKAARLDPIKALSYE
ncbi:MAG: ABC transporter permease [bacterium]|nr:ABC transporter permease [bacterium]